MDTILDAHVRAELANAVMLLSALFLEFPRAAYSHMIELRALPSFTSYLKYRDGEIVLDTEGNRKVRRLDPVQTWIYPSDIARITEHIPGRLTALRTRMDRHTGRLGQLYFGVNPRCVIGTRDDEVTGFTSVIADLDLRKAGLLDLLRSDRLFGEICKLVPEPSAIVDSGYGAHLYYLVSNRSPVTPTVASLWSRVVRGLACALDSLGADHKIANPSRILRLPGTLNRKPVCRKCGAVDELHWKHENKGGWATCKRCSSTPIRVISALDFEPAFDVSGKVVRLVQFDPGVRYSLEELAEVLPEPPPVPTSAQNAVPFSFSGSAGTLAGYPAFRVNAGRSRHDQTLAWMMTLRREGAGQEELSTAVEIARAAFPPERAQEPLQIAQWVWANVRRDPPPYRS